MYDTVLGEFTCIHCHNVADPAVLTAAGTTCETCADGWDVITDREYMASSLLVEANDPREGVGLLTELIPDIGKARSIRTISHRKFWLVMLALEPRMVPGKVYFNDVGLSRGKYVERVYVRNRGSGAMFCLGTYFCTWRIYGTPSGRPFIPSFCKWVGPDFMPHLQNHQPAAS